MQLNGRLTDPSGGVVPNASVAVRNVQTGVEQRTTSTGSGYYKVPNLQPGPYTITVSNAGFRTEVRVVEEVVRIERAVPKKFEKSAVEAVAPPPSRNHIHHASGETPQLLDGIPRGNNGERIQHSRCGWRPIDLNFDAMRLAASHREI